MCSVTADHHIGAALTRAAPNSGIFEMLEVCHLSWHVPLILCIFCLQSPAQHLHQVCAILLEIRAIHAGAKQINVQIIDEVPHR